MSRTITISLYSTENECAVDDLVDVSTISAREKSAATARPAAASRADPRAHGSSPSSASKSSNRVLHPRILLASFRARGVAPLRAAPDDPDALYRQREDIGSAPPRPPISGPHARRRGKDFESAWKLARAVLLDGNARDRRRTARGARSRRQGRRAGDQARPVETRRPLLDGRQHGRAGRVVRTACRASSIAAASRTRSSACWRSIRPGSRDRPIARSAGGISGCPDSSAAATKQAERHLRKSLTYNPQSTATLYFLAEVLADARPQSRSARALPAVHRRAARSRVGPGRQGLQTESARACAPKVATTKVTKKADRTPPRSSRRTRRTQCENPWNGYALRALRGDPWVRSLVAFVVDLLNNEAPVSTCRTPHPSCGRACRRAPSASAAAAPRTSDPCTRRT